MNRLPVAYAGAVRTVGVDLAAEPAKTAVAVVDWTPGRAVVTALTVGMDDAAVLSASTGADRIGVDAPFGWPDAFVSFVAAHHEHRAPPVSLATRADRRPLIKRRTDLVVQEVARVVPLSVSADRIAHVALRCAGLLADYQASGVNVDRIDGQVCEVYPAAALSRWGLPFRGYKGSDGRLAPVAAAVQAAAPWLDLGRFRSHFATDDDAFDAVIAALIARAVALGRTRTPDAGQRAAARREGWIQLPACELPELVVAQ